MQALPLRLYQNEDMIEAKKIYKNYGDLSVLKGVDFIVNKKEIVTIIGKSGAGKSTFLHILGTLDFPDKGEIWYEGEKIDFSKEKNLSDLRNQKIGFVFQFHHLLNEFTALENVCIPAMIAGNMSDENMKRKAKEYLDYLGLKDRISHKPTQLSGGEAQRVAIARAMINQPKVILADEPTGNLDKTNSEEMHRLFIKMRDDFDQSFIIVTHNLELASLSDRTVKMEDGNIID